MYQRRPIFLIAALIVACSESNDHDTGEPDAAGTSTQSDSAPNTGSSNDSSHSESTSPTTGSSESSNADAGDAAVQMTDAGDRDAHLSDAPSDAGADASANLPDADTIGSTFPDADADDADAGDAAADHRFCSDNPLTTVTWSCNDETNECSGAPYSDDCPLQWGCDDYSAAIEAVESGCSELNTSLRTYQACGYSIIEFDSNDPKLAFYAPSGDLVGTWSITDTLEPELCSGSVPEACPVWDVWERESLPEDVQELCVEPGPGSDADAGSDASTD